LRISEATRAEIQALSVERGHRTLVIARKGGKVVAIPPTPRTHGRSTWRSVSVAKGWSSSLRTAVGWTGTQPGGSCARAARRAAITKAR
jgi:hypothetical protein